MRDLSANAAAKLWARASGHLGKHKVAFAGKADTPENQRRVKTLTTDLPRDPRTLLQDQLHEAGTGYPLGLLRRATPNRDLVRLHQRRRRTWHLHGPCRPWHLQQLC